jgi:hypothetical protein
VVNDVCDDVSIDVPDNDPDVIGKGVPVGADLRVCPIPCPENDNKMDEQSDWGEHHVMDDHADWGEHHVMDEQSDWGEHNLVDAQSDWGEHHVMDDKTD